MTLFEWAASQNSQSDMPMSSLPDKIASPGAAALPETPTPPPEPNEIPDAKKRRMRHPPALNLAEPPNTFTAALELLRAADQIFPSILDSWEADLRRAAKLMAVRPEEVPLAPSELVPMLQKIYPSIKRTRQKSWSNIRSSLNSIARAVGLLQEKGRREEIAVVWIPLLEPLQPYVERTPLMHFVYWCSKQGIEPTAVDNVTVETYRASRAAHRYDLDLDAIIRRIRHVWNSAAAKVPGWPQQRLSAPTVRQRNSIPRLEEFPTSFQIDLRAYLNLLEGSGDPFAGRGRPLAKPTISIHRQQSLMAAGLLAGDVGGYDRITSLACLVTPHATRTILRLKYERDGGRWAPSAPLLASVLVSIARYHLNLSPEQLEPLRALQRKIVPAKHGRLSAKVRERLAPFERDKVRKDLFKLADDLCEEAEILISTKPRQAASLHRRGILLHILLRAALRRRNLVTLRLDSDFIRDGRDQIVGLRLQGDRVKNGVVIEAHFPPNVTRALARHLKVFRPLLPASESPWLLPHPTSASHASIDGQASRLAAEVRRRLGVGFNLHLTRHIVATVLYEEDPGNAVVVQRVLGHTDVKTSERMYGEISTGAAQRIWGDSIDRTLDRRNRNRR